MHTVYMKKLYDAFVVPQFDKLSLELVLVGAALYICNSFSFLTHLNVRRNCQRSGCTVGKEGIMFWQGR